MEAKTILETRIASGWCEQAQARWAAAAVRSQGPIVSVRSVSEPHVCATSGAGAGRCKHPHTHQACGVHDHQMNPALQIRQPRRDAQPRRQPPYPTAVQRAEGGDVEAPPLFRLSKKSWLIVLFANILWEKNTISDRKSIAYKTNEPAHIIST